MKARHVLLGLLATLCATAFSIEPYRIEVLEKGSGWPVPLVELRTTNDVRFVTDNAGVVAFDLPEVMGRETWFGVFGHGYEVAPDGCGINRAEDRLDVGHRAIPLASEPPWTCWRTAGWLSASNRKRASVAGVLRAPSPPIRKGCEHELPCAPSRIESGKVPYGGTDKTDETPK